MFGEYAVILGGSALAIPLQGFNGKWKFGNESRRDLGQFYRYMVTKGEFSFLDLDSFGEDLGQGLYFDSDIPEGYGMGSSGAVCAGVFYRYSKLGDIRPEEMKWYLSMMENFFHGSSSGLDPLVSLVHRPVFIQGSSGGISFPDPFPRYSIYLIDTGIRRSTEPLVSWFLSQMEDSVFRKNMEERLVTLNNLGIADCLSGNEVGLMDAWGKVGELQRTFLTRMIPPDFEDIMGFGEYGCVKLCGAGGGGFLMGIASDCEKEEERYKARGISIIWI
jgi:mevalonate kinase